MNLTQFLEVNVQHSTGACIHVTTFAENQKLIRGAECLEEIILW